MYAHCRKAAEDGIVAWDCKEGEEVMLDPYEVFFCGDNPMQAEMCSHAGLASNYPCRTCHVGGTKAFKGSEAGYNTLFVVCLESTYLLQRANTFFNQSISLVSCEALRRLQRKSMNKSKLQKYLGQQTKLKMLLQPQGCATQLQVQL